MSHQNASNKPLCSPIIVALDFPSDSLALSFAQRIDPRTCRVKVGKELYTRCGPSILEALHKLDFDVFLDLKFHDIPNTTAAAVSVAADLGVWMVNVHASGGRRMMEACVETLSQRQHKPKLIGVTVLTSMEQTDLAEVGLDVSPGTQVKNLASLAKDSGLDGIVCSSQEVTMLKTVCGSDFELVTPGIRPASAAADDQRRIMTPRSAVEAGSDYLVIGRPITRADDPSAALEAILKELEGAGETP